ncbi:18979_t:CDS:2 [Rhizophagus irregularis]|nr:18979_t:CDS:2 [Rhizophagus irregularis]
MAPHANIISSFDELQKVSKTTVNLLCEELSRKEARIDDDDVFSSDNYEDYEDIYQ